MLLHVVLEKMLERPLDCKEINPVTPKGNQSWIFIGRTDAKAEAPILWPPYAKNWFIGKIIPMLGKIEGRRRWGRQWEGWMALSTQRMWVWVNSRDSEGQGSLVCCSPYSEDQWTQKKSPGVHVSLSVLVSSVHMRCMAKPIQYCKVISLQLK